MGFFDKIFKKNKTQALPEGNDIVENTVRQNNHKEFVEKIQNDTRESQNNFEGLSREQCYEKVLTMLGVSTKFLENPRAREMIFSDMTELVSKHFLEDYLSGFSDNDILLNQNKFYTRLISDIKKNWIIYEKCIITRKKELIQVGEPIIKTETHEYSFKDNDFVVQKEERYDDTNKAYHLKRVEFTSKEENTYDSNGVEIKRSISNEGIWYGKITEKSFNTERENIDTARYSDNEGRSYILDLVGEHYDIANLTAVSAYYEGGKPDNIYNKDDFYTKIVEKERKGKIESAISKSKFSNGCRKLYENKDIGNER